MRHECFAVRKSNGRAMPAAQPLDGEPDHGAWTDERAERYEQLRIGAEAMSGLKPQEIRCLLLKAEGLSYQEMSAQLFAASATGSYSGKISVSDSQPAGPRLRSAAPRGRGSR